MIRREINRNWDTFELAFLIDQGVNIARKGIKTAVEDSLDQFLSPLALLVNPDRQDLTRDDWKKLGLTEFNSWKSTR